MREAENGSALKIDAFIQFWRRSTTIEKLNIFSAISLLISVRLFSKCVDEAPAMRRLHAAKATESRS